MIKTDENALICDMAEVYGIFDLGSLPASTVAALAFGLRDNSRIKLRLADSKYSTETLLLAVIADGINFLAWSKTEDAARNPNNFPDSIYRALLGLPQKSDSGKCKGFGTSEEFEAARARIIAHNKE